MKILIATDSFKDALPAPQVCRSISKGLMLTGSGFETTLLPLADGGEGTAEILQFHLSGNIVNVDTVDPLFRSVKGAYLLSADRKTAYLDMATASGLQLLKDEERNPMNTTSKGTGMLIADAVRKGVKKLYLGIGGSATNDCGMGMAAALGYRFFDANDVELEPIGGNLHKVVRFEKPVDDSLQDLEVVVLSDVDNPLYGPDGAAYVYGPQKGADPEMVEQLDQGLAHFGNILESEFQQQFHQVPGAGAAGGLGAGALAFLNARLQPGIQTILELIDFAAKLKAADWVITGEGKIDDQTVHGKLIKGVCEVARQYEKPVLAVCGTLAASPTVIEAIGLKAAFSILNWPMTLKEALTDTELLLEQLSYNIGRLLL